jgi:Resolvase, N terminal domain/Recombinase/Recombinase zinc beta ribbon domain
MARVVGYIRQSLNDKKSSSPEHQATTIANWCAEHKHKLVHTYTDIGGKRSEDLNPRTRPNFIRMIGLARARKLEADIIVVADQTRFGTGDIYVFMGYLKELRDAGIALWDATKNVLLNPAGTEFGGILTSTIGSILDTGEQVSRAQRTVNGCISKVKRTGAHLGGKLPYGLALRCVTPAGVEIWHCETVGKKSYLKSTPDGREVVMTRLPTGDRGESDLLLTCPSRFPDRIQGVKMIFEQYVAGINTHKIAALLNKRGFRTQYGTSFYASFVDWILKYGVGLTGRPAYGRSSVGKYHQHRTKTVTSAVENLQGRRTYKPQDDWLRSEVELFPPIISEESWDAARKMRQDKRGKPRVSGRPTAVFTGLLVCSHCGRRMTANFTRNKQKYQCTTNLTQGGPASGCHVNTIRQEVLDPHVNEFLETIGASLAWTESKQPLKILYSDKSDSLRAIDGLRAAIELWLYDALSEIFEYKQRGEFRIFTVSDEFRNAAFGNGWDIDIPETIRLPGYSGCAGVLQDIADFIEHGQQGHSRQQLAKLRVRLEHLLSIFPEATLKSVRDKLLQEIGKCEGEISILESGVGTSFNYRTIVKQLLAVKYRAAIARDAEDQVARRAAILAIIREIRLEFTQVPQKNGSVSRLASLTFVPHVGEPVLKSVSTGTPLT